MEYNLSIGPLSTNENPRIAVSDPQLERSWPSAAFVVLTAMSLNDEGVAVAWVMVMVAVPEEVADALS